MSDQPRHLPQRVPAHPGSSSRQISARMSRLQRRDNPRELAIRRELHALGLRYRVHYLVPGGRRRTIDIAFTRRKLAVFLDGCFWHGCPVHGTRPRSNAGWWQQKLRANQQRDRDTDRILRDLGWTVLRIWEHEPLESAVQLVADAQREAAGLALPTRAQSALFG
jgi:DNA mismatch endonuclease, patch repair protein